MLAYIDPGTGYTIVSAGGWLLALALGAAGALGLWLRRFTQFLRGHVLIALLSLALVVFAVWHMWGSFSSLKTPSMDGRVVILGFDGMSPPLVEEMMSRGELPNFAALRARGSYARIATTNPPQSPVAWSAIATGQNPGKNGVYDFIVRNPKDYSLRLALSDMQNGIPQRVIKSKPFWQYLSDRKIESVLLGFPLTFPAEKITGRMLSGMGVPDILGTEGTFTFYTSEAHVSSPQAGGNVVTVRKGETIVLKLNGPRVSGSTGEAENATVPVEMKLDKAQPNSARFRWQKSETTLEVGKWSAWQDVSFDVGWMKGMKGIFKFYLVALEPEIKLYVTPINFDPRSPYFSISYPESYSSELAESVGLYATVGMPMDTWGLNESRITESAFLEQTDSIFNEKLKMLDLELGRVKKGVLFSYFEAPDIIQHMFWRYHEESEFSREAPAELRETIASWYKKMDAVLGDVLAKSSGKDTVVALSDHGMDAFHRSVNVNSWLRQNGYLALKDPALREGRALLADIDWAKTRAYALGFGAIYLNRRGREQQGIVDPGHDSEALKSELREKLLGWRDPQGDKAVLKSVYPREEIFWGQFSEETPDLYLGFNSPFRASWQTAIGATPEFSLEDNLKPWSGDHLVDPQLVPGIFFSTRPFSPERSSAGPTLYDVAPSILSLCGFSATEIEKMGFDGKPLF